MFPHFETETTFVVCRSVKVAGAAAITTLAPPWPGGHSLVIPPQMEFPVFSAVWCQCISNSLLPGSRTRDYRLAVAGDETNLTEPYQPLWFNVSRLSSLNLISYISLVCPIPSPLYLGPDNTIYWAELKSGLRSLPTLLYTFKWFQMSARFLTSVCTGSHTIKSSSIFAVS